MRLVHRALSAVMITALLSIPSVIARAAGTPVWMHRTVSTHDAAAQQAFDEGLTCLYAFNRECAQARFQAAAEHDASLAIAWWGYAMALGPNVNYPSDKVMIGKAIDALAKAQRLETNATPAERALIAAAVPRYAITNSGKAEVRALDYARQMKKAAGAFPDDADIAAFYVESWLDVAYADEADTNETESLEDGEALVHRVEAQTRRWPQHLGLQHYFIHLSEPGYIGRAVDAANTLFRAPLAPEASHLNHMASHVYYYLGQWHRFSQASRLAIEMDQAQAAARGIEPQKLDYWRHNLDFWYGGAVMSADEASARDAVAVSKFPLLAWMCADRFGHSDEAMRLIDGTHAGDQVFKSRNVRFEAAYALANANAGRISEAQRSARLLPAPASDEGVPAVAVNLVQGRIAELKGDTATARTLYTRAALAQDHLSFEAAPPWYFAPRELLAAMELRLGNAQAAVQAAQADLRHHPHDVRILAILRDASMKLGDAAAAERAQRDIDVTQGG